ncbi:MAG: hypothetical protein AAGE59_19090 [Cyanobacteria bacterium P01_F01_bin.86]
MNNSLTDSNGHSRAKTGWEQVSVREFFSAIAWAGEAVTPTIPSSAVEIKTLDSPDVLLSVQAFFECFPWEGEPDVAAPLSPLAIQSDSPSVIEELTLEGFADFF